MLNKDNSRPLAGVKVLTIENQVSAPFCTMMLADAGAEVIKIETPGRGDSSREAGPIIKKDGEKTSGYFMRFNRQKKSLTLNLKEDEGKDILKKLVKEADVLVENLRPGSLKGMGLGYDELSQINPRLIYATISGFGQLAEGPYSERPAYDIIVQAMGGLMNLVGEENGPPLHPMLALGDIVPGMLTAYAISLALIKRDRTGEGDFIDMAMYDVVLALTERAHTLYSLTQQVMTRGKETLIHPWGAFPTKDGYVAIIVLEARMWARFCQAIERPELEKDERFANAMLRAKNRADLDPVINEWMVSRTCDQVIDTLLKAKVPAGKVRDSSEVFDCPQARSRGMWVKSQHPIAGEVELIGSPIRMKNVPHQSEVLPSPELGEHSAEVLAKLLGMSDEDIAGLKDKGII